MEVPPRTASTATVPEATGGAVVAGGTLGRFAIERTLGTGGMGIVFAAHDPVLDRRVAVKLMRVAIAADSADSRRGRLLREAQALAKLTHPNVVTVYEAGVIGSAVFIAMELVEGGTLRDWMAQERPWREVVAMFVGAGRGLAAAHAAGLVHRDFKPANVLIDGDGRAKVSDFGLVGLADSDAPSSVAPAADSPLHTTLTETGAALGTPAYMAPEQVRGEHVDARADQYSFCVSLHEALFGHRPDDGVADGARPRSVPGWLQRAVMRGLEADPEARHPSMAALVDLLDRRPRRGRRIAIAAIAATALGGAAAGGWLLSRGEPAAAPAGVDCDGAGDGFAAVWTETARGRVVQAFTAAVPYGAEAGARAGKGIDDYGARWSGTRIEACRATHERGEQSPELLDRRMSCLDRALVDVAATVDLLGHATKDVVEKAARIVATLPDPSACNPALQSATVPIPDEPRAQALVADLAKLRTLILKGDFKAARSLAIATRDAATSLGHPGLLAQALGRYAEIMESEDPAAAKAALEQALAEAARAGDRDQEAFLSLRMLERAYKKGERDPIEALLPIARAAAAREGVSRALRRDFANREAIALDRLGKFDEALQACARIAPLEDDSHLTSTQCPCVVTSEAQRNDEAVRYCQAALDVSIKELGEHHPLTAARMANQAMALGRIGRNEESLAMSERSLAVNEATYGPDSLDVAEVLAIVAGKRIHLGQFEQALRDGERVLAIQTKAGETSPRRLGLTYELIGKVQVRLGKHDEGVPNLQKALKLTETALGPEHPGLTIALFNTGEALNIANRPQDGLAAYRRCTDLSVKTHGPEHFVHGACMMGQARSLIFTKRAREGRPLAEKALAILTAAGAPPELLAVAHETVASALARGGGDRARARAEFEKAIELYQAAGPGAEHDIEAARSELAKLPP